MLSGRKPPPRLWQIALRTVVLSVDIDPSDGVAAVWLRRSGPRPRESGAWLRSAQHLFLYERTGQRWEPVGGGSSEPAPDTSAVTTLTVRGSSSVRSLADRMRTTPPVSFTDVGWVSCVAVQVFPQADDGIVVDELDSVQT